MVVSVLCCLIKMTIYNLQVCMVVSVLWCCIKMTICKGELRALWVGVLVAVPSGAGVALSVLGGNAGSLV